MKRPRASISIHDVTPAWEAEVIAAYTAISDWGISSPSLLIVPNHHGRWPLTAFPGFVNRLKSWIRAGSEVLLHGYYHLASNPVPFRNSPVAWLESRLLTAGEGEFLALSESQVKKRLLRGKKELEKILQCHVSGFVPPAWLRQPHLARHLREAGLTHYEGHFYLYNLLKPQRLLAPAITFSARSWFRVCSSIGFARVMQKLLRGQCDIRLALHPADFKSKHLIQAVGSLAEALSSAYQWVGYSDLIGESQ
ncbi:MAG: DUF2334 domain-containing protein [Proteobacteria bacterium]|nr:DUF2334 domain-containing protein [Pseudomonadota bacterium]